MVGFNSVASILSLRCVTKFFSIQLTIGQLPVTGEKTFLYYVLCHIVSRVTLLVFWTYLGLRISTATVLNSSLSTMPMNTCSITSTNISSSLNRYRFFYSLFKTDMLRVTVLPCH